MTDRSNGDAPSRQRLLQLSLAALGVVYGDIGTSPLYSMRECFLGSHGVPPTPANVLGVLSLIVWALLIVVSVKYISFILRADNRGEGGILALMALLRPERGGDRWVVVALGLFGSALLYGDGVITPAISVLSAVEGLEIAAPALARFVLPLTVAILVGLFVIQRQGTARVGSVFGPVTLLWFLTIAALGIVPILREPRVFGAINPVHAVDFLLHHGHSGFLVLGSVFLVVTGGEALYADMGHFGRRPIRLVWFCLVLPSLLLNYFGQGALIMADRTAAESPFYHLVPSWALYPVVGLATAATVIASQAVISGCFSLTRQAIQLGYCPRIQIDHTSAATIGQIYIAPVNWSLAIFTIGLVVSFGSSSALAAAYGIAVTTTMLITTGLFYLVAVELWKWPRWACLALSGAFLVADGGFFGANVVKISHGGWVPLALAGGIFVLMSTWKRGRAILFERLRTGAFPVDVFLADVAAHPPQRVPGTAVFMTARPEGVPSALLHNLKHNKILHERIVLLTVTTEEIPHVNRKDRIQVDNLGKGFYRIVARYGFMEDPDIPALLRRAQSEGLEFSMMDTTFFLGRETLIPSKKPGMAVWREKLFSFLTKVSQRATAFYRIPPNRVVEIGLQVEL